MINSFGGGDDGFDPIVMNLHGGAVSTVGTQTSGVSFKPSASQQPVETGWVASGEGFLVRDPQGVSITSADQLIGGMSDLSALDVNRDGVLDASDTSFSELGVWTPSVLGNGDTLASMAALGIKDIRLNATTVNQSDDGNVINSTFTFDYLDGGSGNGVDVTFAASTGAPTTQWADPGLIIQAISTFNPPAAPSTSTPTQAPTKPETLIAATH